MSLENPFFSVVIPTYNHEFFLKKAVESVLAQTFNDYEIIIIDNYSNDNTQNLIKNFNNKKINYVKNHNHGLLAISRNMGIEKSQGKWIAFLDSDDTWYPEKLMIINNFLKKNIDYDVICNNELIIDKINNRKVVWKYGPYKSNFYELLIKYGNLVSTSASVVNKEYLLNNNFQFSEERNFAPYEDYDFWMRLAKNDAKFKFLNNVLGEHLFHQESWGSKNRLLCKKSNFYILNYHVFNLQNFTSKNISLWSHVESRLKLDELIESLVNKKYFKSLIYLINLLFKYPIKTINNLFYRLKRKF